MSKGQRAERSEILSTISRQRWSHQLFEMGRNTALGGAAVALVILVQVIQTGVTSHALHVAIIATALAIPIFTVIAITTEIPLSLGPESYDFVRLRIIRKVSLVLWFASGGALIIAIGGVLCHLSALAFWIFVISTLVSFLITVCYWAWMVDWWFSWGPGAPEKVSEPENPTGGSGVP